MKKSFLIVAFIFLFISCSMNPNKEDRIQKLETEMKTTLDKLHTLQGINKQLEIRINKLEQQ